MQLYVGILLILAAIVLFVVGLKKIKKKDDFSVKAIELAFAALALIAGVLFVIIPGKIVPPPDDPLGSTTIYNTLRTEETRTKSPSTQSSTTLSPKSLLSYKVVTQQGSPLRVRNGPGTEYEMTGTIPNGKVVFVVIVERNWGYVQYGNITGWCSMEFLEPAT